ncbi:MAG: chemotaxis protein CheW [Chloroflexi bacterium]|nr:chemotaxis protein CheW [Chloroflexota bacterium]
METQVVVFEVANEHFGVDIAAIEGILNLQPITQLPHAPEFIEGVTNLRGSIVPIIDLRKRFGLEQTPPTRETRIVVAFLDQIKAGMIVDSVARVMRISDELIEPTPPMVATIDSAYIQGIAKLDGQLIIILDLKKVLDRSEKEALPKLPVN